MRNRSPTSAAEGTFAPGVRTLTAPNPGAFTLTGTNTYVVDGDPALIIDPGPEDREHLSRVEEAVETAESVRILLTHDHPDHAAGALPLAEALGADVVGPGGGRSLTDGETIEYGAGRLVAVHTPGHTVDHLCFHDPERGDVFCGDLLLGEGNTTWIGEYPGGVGDYLKSLDRVEGLGPRVLYPGHGPLIEDPHRRIDLFRRHRRNRIAQVSEALARTPGAGPADLVRAVYGEIPAPLEAAARRSVEAILDYLQRGG